MSYESHLFPVERDAKSEREFALFCLGYNLERAKNLLGFEKILKLMKQA